MTTQLEQAARLALEALEKSYKINGYPENKKAINALRAALEQPAQDDVEQSSTQSKETFDQQEPVAITITGKLGNIYSFTGDYSLKKGDKVYTRPQQPAQDEPVACMCGICKLGKPEPLTYEEIEKLAEQVGMYIDKYGLAFDAENGLEDGVDAFGFARAIEAAHGITGEKK